MNTRILIALGLSLLACGLCIGAAGMLLDDSPIMRASVLVSLTAVPALIVGALRREHTATEDALADAHRAGYALALDHVARGLLDQPTAPTGGDRTDHNRAANVHHLYAVRDDNKRATG